MTQGLSPPRMPGFSGINGYFISWYCILVLGDWSTNVLRNWYQNVKYPLIPEKSGRRRGIPREGDKYFAGQFIISNTTTSNIHGKFNIFIPENFKARMKASSVLTIN